MQENVSWDDLKLALAITRAGSLAGAARRLDVNHATVFRRLRTLETRIGVVLFERHRGGYTPTAAGEEMAAAALRMETEALGVMRRIAGRDLKPSGTVRVTTTDTLLAGLVSPMLAGFRHRYPDIALEIAVSNAQFDLTRRHADMAVRPVDEPPEALIAQALGHVAMAAYVPADWVDGDNSLDVTTVDWVGLDDSVTFAALTQWMSAHGVDGRCVCRVDSVAGMLQAVAGGIGCALLPCYLADRQAGLVRITPPVDALTTKLWLLIHPDLRHVARIRALRDFIIEAFAQPAVVQRLAGSVVR